MKQIIKYIAIIVNALYFLWIIYNAIDEGFKFPGAVQFASYIGMLALLILNIFLLSHIKVRDAK